jgi:hypothetical protein
VSDYGLDDQGSIPGWDKRIFSLATVSRPALRPTQLLLSNGYRESFLVVQRDRGVALTTHPCLVLQSGMSRSYAPFPLTACMAVVVQLYFTSSVVLLLSQWWIPPFRIKFSDCSPFFIMCYVLSAAVLCRECIECCTVLLLLLLLLLLFIYTLFHCDWTICFHA